MKTICYVGGCGRLGSALAAWSAEKGHKVYCIDVNEEAVNAMNRGEWHSPEPLVGEPVSAWHGKRLFATTEYHPIADADIVFVIVPTPSEADGAFSLKYVMQACDQIRQYLGDNTVVVIVSTVMPGDSERLMARLGTRHVVYSPEFIRQGSIVHDFANPDVVLIGESNFSAGNAAEDYYKSIVENTPAFRRMSLVDAEIAKIGLNACIVQRMATSAQITWLCQHTPGADSWNVLSAIAADPRIGAPYFERTLYPGGPCFPRDCRALALASWRVGAEAAVAAAADTYLEIQAHQLRRLVMGLLPEEGMTVGLLGLTYKPGVDITTESLALALAEELSDLFFSPKIFAYDPMAVVESPYFERVGYLRVLVARSDVLVLTVKWPQFKALEKMDLNNKVLIDCWGFIDRNKVNCRYVRLGKGL